MTPEPLESREQELAELAREALDIQDASNLSGVAHAFARVVSKLRELGFDTPATNTHPVTRLFVAKLTSLSYGADYDFGSAYDICKHLAEEES